jgi:hypothetical protein
MKKYMLWISLAALIIPGLARELWFYRGIPTRPKISTPDYQALTISQPPLETPVAETDLKQTNGVVLFDFAHANQYQPSEVQSLREAIEKRGGQVEIVSDAASLEYKLKYASAYTIISPSTSFTADETRVISAFILRGGRLLVFTDATHGVVSTDYNSGAVTALPDANIVNPLLAPFGITVNNDYLYNVKDHEGNFRNVFFDRFGKSELTFGLKKIALYGTHSIKSTSGLILLRGTDGTLSSIDDGQDPATGGAALSRDGNVLVLGDITFLSSPYQIVLDNSTLIGNIADYSLGGRQSPTFDNFPYIFTAPELQVYLTSKIQLTADTISAISGLQSSLKMINMSVKLVTEAPQTGDAIILGTFTPTDDLSKFTDPFNIKFDDTSETIGVKGIGNIGRTGSGLLLFDKNPKGNKLTLLADTQDNLITLLNTVASGSLDGCILQDDIGVCGVGYGSSFSANIGSSVGTSEPTKNSATPTPGG